VTVRFADGDGGPNPLVACDITVTGSAVTTPAPTPVPTPVPTTAPVTTVPVATFPVFIPISVSQQQQQQQQGGGGGGGGSAGHGGQQQQGHASGGGQQQQQQQQSDGISLPRTGAEVGRMSAWGGGLLALGLVLVLFARRRRSRARSRALAELPPIDAVVVEPAYPWLPGTAHPSEFLTEADGLPPVYVPMQLALPPAPDADEDVLTPSF
jgi:LPXTG-motif cell wall-anchored protein